ncbi:MAG: hypothetical protein LBM28_03575 [Oscillospiraceae bacterium]|nr:hypothetical protein [Oscillospiraceae bacterium]
MANYKIAGLIVKMETFGRTLKQAEPYRVETDEPAHICVASNPQKLQEEHPHLSFDDCEYISTAGSFYRHLPFYDGVMLHASCVVVDGLAYLFSAASGTGKSTHVKLWLRLFGERTFVLNDDKPALRVIDGQVYVYGTPWSGKHDRSRNVCAPLGGIAVLKRAQENSIRKLSPQEAMFPLLNQTTRGRSAQVTDRIFSVLEGIVKSGKIYELSCNMDISAAKLSYETMSGKRFEL